MRKSMLRTIEAVRPFVPVDQLKILVSLLRGEERGFFREKLREVQGIIENMPVTYQQSELEDSAVVHLHYFGMGGDWWITEKDVEGGTRQAFGLVDLGRGPELGYISIDELVADRSIELDLYWKPVTLAQLKAQKYPPKPSPRAYTVEMVQNVGDVFGQAPANGVYH